jgi:hypothetical protein
VTRCTCAERMRGTGSSYLSWPTTCAEACRAVCRRCWVCVQRSGWVMAERATARYMTCQSKKLTMQAGHYVFWHHF